MNFKTALRRHSALATSVATVNNDPLRRAFEGAWNALMGIRDDEALAVAVRFGIPVTHIPLMRSVDGVPAVYFLCIAIATEADTPLAVDDYKDPAKWETTVETAFNKFEEVRRNANAMAEGFGWDGALAWNTMRQVEDKTPVVMQRMLDVALKAGAIFDRMAYEGIPRECRDPQTVSGVAAGDELARMLPEEVAMLSVPGASADVLARLEERQVLQLDMTGESPKHRGALVIALDESGSMSQHRMTWSKACAVALARIAAGEHRVVRVVRFSTSTRVLDVGVLTPACVNELASGHLSGGTDIGLALRTALAQVDDLAQAGQTGADIVLITDGEDSSSKAGVLQRMADSGVKLWSIAIDCDFSKGSGRDIVQASASYTHIPESALTSASGVDIAAGLKRAALDDVEMN